MREEGRERRDGRDERGSLRVARARAVSSSKRDCWQAVRERHLKVHQERCASRYRALDALLAFYYIKALGCQERADIKSAPIESLSESAKSFKVKRF